MSHPMSGGLHRLTPRPIPPSLIHTDDMRTFRMNGSPVFLTRRFG